MPAFQAVEEKAAALFHVRDNTAMSVILPFPCFLCPVILWKAGGLVNVLCDGSR